MIMGVGILRVWGKELVKVESEVVGYKGREFSIDF